MTNRPRFKALERLLSAFGYRPSQDKPKPASGYEYPIRDGSKEAQWVYAANPDRAPPEWRQRQEK